MGQPLGIETAAVEAWVGERLHDLTPPFQWLRLEGGHSNLTYEIEDTEGRKAVVRRPPLGKWIRGLPGR